MTKSVQKSEEVKKNYEESKDLFNQKMTSLKNENHQLHLDKTSLQSKLTVAEEQLNSLRAKMEEYDLRLVL